MNYGKTLSQLRKKKGYTQAETAEYISQNSDKACSFKVVSHWENGVSSPSVEQFLLMCEFYDVENIQSTFRKVLPILNSGVSLQSVYGEFGGLAELNSLGKNMVKEYISMLSANSLFSEAENEKSVKHIRKFPKAGSISDAEPIRRIIKLYDIPAAAGFGSFLDSDHFEEIEVDETAPKDADFAVKVSGDSMEPRFVSGEVIYIKSQNVLDVGSIGLFALNGDSYVKKLGIGELISLNPKYEPMPISEHDSFYVFGKVLSGR